MLNLEQNLHACLLAIVHRFAGLQIIPSTPVDFPPNRTHVYRPGRIWSLIHRQPSLSLRSTWDTVDRSLKNSRTLALGAEQSTTNSAKHESAAPNNDETAARRQERPEFTDGQMRTIQQLIADNVKQSAREIETEAARAVGNVCQASFPKGPRRLCLAQSPTQQLR